MGRVGASARDCEIDAAERELFDIFWVIAELAAAIHLHFVAALRELLH